MDKNSIIGFVLIGLIFFGFTFYQSKQYEKQVAYQAQLDSIANVKCQAQMRADSIAYAQARINDSLENEAVRRGEVVKKKFVYKDTLLDVAASAKDTILTLQNAKMEVAFNTRGAQPYSVKLLNYKTYRQNDLYLFKPGKSEFSHTIYTGETISTKNFTFRTVEHTDSTLVMRLPFSNGGYIEQKYVLEKDSFHVRNLLSFVNMGATIPRNVSSFDTDWNLTVPRMEKGYKNEVQYSKLNYHFVGDDKPEDTGMGRSNSKRIENKLDWFAFQQQFFSAIMRAENNFSSGELSVNFIAEDDADQDLMNCSAKMRNDFDLASGSAQIPFDFYFGPNHYNTLKSYKHKYEKIIPLGGWMVGWITRFVIIPVFNFLHRFISNFGIIILLMTIFIKLVVLPFAYKSYSSSAKMQALKPEIDKLNEKYPREQDAMKKQTEMMALYQRAGISPMGGCLPMLLQFPILWAMFRFFPASIELRQQGFLWADDLSSYDSIIDFGFKIPLLGDHISLFALLMAVSMFLYSKVTAGSQMSGNDPNAKMMRFMSIWMMPIMMYFICNSLSSGLSYYYLLSNLITMLETWIIRKWFIHPEEILAKVRANAGKKAPKSKWQLKLEEAQRMQEQMMREQNKKK